MIALLHDIHSQKIQGHPFRGFTVLSENTIREVSVSVRLLLQLVLYTYHLYNF